MKHNWKLNCTINELINEIVAKLDSYNTHHPLSELAEEASIGYHTKWLAEQYICAQFSRLGTGHLLECKMNPHMRQIVKRNAAWLAKHLQITESNAQALKRKACSVCFTILTLSARAFMNRYWTALNEFDIKNIKKYFEVKYDD